MEKEQNDQNNGQSQAPVILEFEGKGNDVKVISFNDIASSIRREQGLAGIRAVPKQFWGMYAAIIHMLQDTGMNYNEGDIFVQNNSSKAYLTDDEKAAGYNQKHAPINRWRFDKIISTIQIPNLVEDQNEGVGDARNAAIGLTLNKEGLSVAFGMNVHACSNFNVMGGSIMQSYNSMRRESLPWDVMQTRLETWLGSMDQMWSVQNDIMAKMKDYSLGMNEGAVEEVVGELYIGAMKHSYFKGAEMPFNTHELGEFVRESIKQQKESETIANVWELYNWGTSIMKPGSMDIGEIGRNSNLWSEHLINKFELDVDPILVIDSE
jgi:hypothetical protein